MRKITVLIEGSHKTLYLSENVSGITTGSTLTVESATVYWDVIMTIPVPSGVDLKRTVTQHHTDTRPVCGIPVQNGCFNSIAFDVNTNIGPTHIGSILLELCISDK